MTSLAKALVANFAKASMLCGRGRSLALGLYGVSQRRQRHVRLRARARAACLRGRDVFRSEKSALQPTHSSLSACHSSQEPAPRRTRVWTCSPRLARAIVRDSSGRERQIPKTRRTQMQLGEFRSRARRAPSRPYSTGGCSPSRGTRPPTPLPICARACALADRPARAWPCSQDDAARRRLQIAFHNSRRLYFRNEVRRSGPADPTARGRYS